jgi:hypothetical protein
MPPEALEITRKFMSKPVRILVKRDELTLEGIKQFLFVPLLLLSALLCEFASRTISAIRSQLGLNFQSWPEW